MKMKKISTHEIVSRLQSAEDCGRFDFEAMCEWHAYTNDPNVKLFVLSVKRLIEAIKTKYGQIT